MGRGDGFGPLYVNKLGVGWQSTPPVFDLLFDGSVKLAGFDLDLIGLQIGIPVSSDITDSMPCTLRMRLIVSSFNQRLTTVPVSVTTPPLTATTGRRDP